MGGDGQSDDSAARDLAHDRRGARGGQRGHRRDVRRLLARYTEGQERKPLHGLQQLIRYASSEDSAAARTLRETLTARMAALLTSPNATPDAKAFVCGQFPAVATDKQASALAALLADKDLADPALRGLAMIPGVAVDQILREALEQVVRYPADRHCECTR